MNVECMLIYTPLNRLKSIAIFMYTAKDGVLRLIQFLQAVIPVHNASFNDNTSKLDEIMAVQPFLAATFNLAYKLPNMELKAKKTSTFNVSLREDRK